MYFPNHGSYSTKFSTIFRLTQGAIVSTKLDTKDYSGFDPLPDHIAEAKILFWRGSKSSESASSSIPLDHLRQDDGEPSAGS